MTGLREIMRLSALGQAPRAVVAAAGSNESTIRRVLAAAEFAGLEWPLPEEMGDDAIRRVSYPKSGLLQHGPERVRVLLDPRPCGPGTPPVPAPGQRVNGSVTFRLANFSPCRTRAAG